MEDFLDVATKSTEGGFFDTLSPALLKENALTQIPDNAVHKIMSRSINIVWNHENKIIKKTIDNLRDDLSALGLHISAGTEIKNPSDPTIYIWTFTYQYKAAGFKSRYGKAETGIGGEADILIDKNRETAGITCSPKKKFRKFCFNFPSKSRQQIHILNDNYSYMSFGIFFREKSQCNVYEKCKTYTKFSSYSKPVGGYLISDHGAIVGAQCRIYTGDMLLQMRKDEDKDEKRKDLITLISMQTARCLQQALGLTYFSEQYSLLAYQPFFSLRQSGIDFNKLKVSSGFLMEKYCAYDALMLKILYNKKITPGMDRRSLIPLVTRIVQEERSLY